MTTLRGLDQNPQILGTRIHPCLSHEILTFSPDPQGTQFRAKVLESPAGFLTYILRRDWAVVSKNASMTYVFHADTEIRGLEKIFENP